MTMLPRLVLLTLPFALAALTNGSATSTVPQPTATRSSNSMIVSRSPPSTTNGRKVTSGVRGAAVQVSSLSSRHLKNDNDNNKGRNMNNNNNNSNNSPSNSNNNVDQSEEEYTNVHGLVERMPCAPFDLAGVQDRRRSSLTDKDCQDNSCGGCCRMYNWLLCDADNTYDHLQCVCNSITTPLPEIIATASPVTVMPTPSPTPLPTPLPTQPPATAAPSTTQPVSATPTSLAPVETVNAIGNTTTVTLSNATLADRLDEATPVPADNGFLSTTISPINTNNIISTTSPPATPVVSPAPMTYSPTMLVPVVVATAPPTTAPPTTAAPTTFIPTTRQPSTVAPTNKITPAPIPVLPWQQCANGSSYHVTADSGTCKYAEDCSNRDECCVRNFCLCAKAKGLEDQCVPSRFNNNNNNNN